MVLNTRLEPYYGGNYLQFLQNDGTGHFTDETAERFGNPELAPDTNLPRLHWTNNWQVLDVNDDGKLDIVGETANWQSKSAVIYLNDGTGHFKRFEVPLEAGHPGSILAWGDFNGNGRIELVQAATTFDQSVPSSATGIRVLELNLTTFNATTLSEPGATDSEQSFQLGGAGNDRLAGDSQANWMLSFAGDDQISGLAGDDRLLAFAGNDTLDGGQGRDTLTGGAGDDTYYVDHAQEEVEEFAGQGTDTVYASVNYALSASAAVETLRTTSVSGKTAINLTGNAIANTLHGNAGANKLDGKTGADRHYGYGGNDTYTVDNAGDKVVETSTGGTADLVYSSISHTLASYVEKLYASGSSSITLTGNTSANTIKGNAGANKINGGLGRDALYGSSGKDTFVFNSKQSSANVDNLADYKVADDTIHLENAVFTKLKVGKLAAAAFWKGGKAHDTNDRIIYDAAKGYLYYDADGAGASKQVLFATTSKNLKMASTEFVVI